MFPAAGAPPTYTCYRVCMLHRRLQIMIDDRRLQRLQDHATERGTSVAAVIRDLVDTALPATDERRAVAARILLDPDRMPVPDDPADLRRELDEAHDRV